MKAEADAAAAAEAQMKAEADAAAAAEAQMKAEADAAAAAEAQMKAEADAAAAAEAQMKAEADRMKAEADEKAAADELAEETAKKKAADLGALYRGLLRRDILDDPTTVAVEADANDPYYTALVAAPTIEAAYGKVTNIYAPEIADDENPAVGSDAAFALFKPTALDRLGDWNGADIMATNADGIIDHVNVYTDVNVGTEITFEMLFPTADTLQDDARFTDDYNERDRIVNESGLNKHEGLISAMMENADGDTVDVFQTGSGTRTHGNPAHEGELISIPGTFAGATGIYRCQEAAAANNCVSSGTDVGTMLGGGTDATGVVITTNALWTFNVDSGQKASVPDGKYAYFGWWLRAYSSGFWDADAFHGTVNMTGIEENPTTDLTGSATYNGQAAGKVAINPQLPGRVLIGGAFTADATLTANFDADDGDPGTLDERGMISGTIDNFNVGGEDLDGWSVALGGSRIVYGDGTADTPLPDFMGGATTWIIDDTGSTTNGTWSGNFYDANAVDGVPDVVTGEFTASYNSQVGRMEGAFGANR